jgi:hypothetical protein
VAPRGETRLTAAMAYAAHVARQRGLAMRSLFFVANAF